MDIKELNEAIEIVMKEDYKELQNDKSLDIYRKILDNNEKIDDYIFQDKKHVLIKFHNVTPKDRKQVIILDDKFEERLNKAYDKCRKVNESLKQTKSSKKSIKEEMEYNRKLWDIFEENVAEYLNEHGVKPEGNNVMNYISKNAVEIVKAVLEKEYNYEEDDQAIFELYYNCPIHFTDKAQAIDKLLEEYLAESLKRCLTIEDKLLQISSLDKNESVTDKKVIKESNGETVYVLMDADDSDILSVYSAESLIEYAEWHRQEILKLADGENIGWDKINDIPNAIEFLTEAKDFKVFTEIVQ